MNLYWLYESLLQIKGFVSLLPSSLFFFSAQTVNFFLSLLIILLRQEKKKQGSACWNLWKKKPKDKEKVFHRLEGFQVGDEKTIYFHQTVPLCGLEKREIKFILQWRVSFCMMRQLLTNVIWIFICPMWESCSHSLNVEAEHPTEVPAGHRPAGHRPAGHSSTSSLDLHFGELSTNVNSTWNNIFFKSPSHWI